LTASIGIVCYPEHGDVAELLLENVDKALYRAKNRGRTGSRYSLSMPFSSLPEKDFVGKQEELDGLTKRIVLAHGSQARSAVLSGPRGMGKTELLKQLSGACSGGMTASPRSFMRLIRRRCPRKPFPAPIWSSSCPRGSRIRKRNRPFSTMMGCRSMI